jgi:hypothetical protein
VVPWEADPPVGQAALSRLAGGVTAAVAKPS